jgi:hypothetical protein
MSGRIGVFDLFFYCLKTVDKFNQSGQKNIVEVFVSIPGKLGTDIRLYNEEI